MGRLTFISGVPLLFQLKNDNPIGIDQHLSIIFIFLRKFGHDKPSGYENKRTLEKHPRAQNGIVGHWILTKSAYPIQKKSSSWYLKILYWYNTLSPVQKKLVQFPLHGGCS